jgi:hypothetical protein
MRVAIVDDVEPVSPPSFAIVGRGEEAVNKSFVSIGAVIV